MVSVDEWLDEYEDLVVDESEYPSNANPERLHEMRFKLKAILWGKKLV